MDIYYIYFSLKSQCFIMYMTVYSEKNLIKMSVSICQCYQLTTKEDAKVNKVIVGMKVYSCPG
jgi:hypothetical protein